MSSVSIAIQSTWVVAPRQMVCDTCGGQCSSWYVVISGPTRVSLPRCLVINLVPFFAIAYHTIGSSILRLDGLGPNDARKGERRRTAHGSYIVTAGSARFRLHGPSCQGKELITVHQLLSLQMLLVHYRPPSHIIFCLLSLDSWKRPSALLLDTIVATTVWWS